MMLNKSYRWLFILIILISAGCSNPKKEKSISQKKMEEQAGKQQNTKSYQGFIPSIAKFESFDNGRFLETETAFFVEKDIVVCRLSKLREATDVLITPLNENKKYKVTGYVAVDRINDLVLLKVDGIERTPIQLFNGVAPVSAKTIYLSKPQNNTLPLHKGKVLAYSNYNGTKRYKISNKFLGKTYGTPIFVSTQKTIGLAFSEVVDYEVQYFAIPSHFIIDLLTKKSGPKKLTRLKTSASKATSEANSKIKGLLIKTDAGDIKIRLFNETPVYRDNFIRLVREGYYDSLLVHRVINDFCIQTGAADTRYAGPDDIVGWKGPGYSLPAHIVPELYHKRGMIGSPRKPDRRNSKRRSDGSQFYIVTGRTYSDAELDEIEAENGHKFTPAQRQVYKTIGGAPHIDGTYTIFGEVIQGMAVADLLARVPVNSDFRPQKDIRVQKITIIP